MDFGNIIDQCKSNVSSQLDLLHSLKNIFENESAIVMSCGPSLNKISTENIKKLQADKLVLCVKQAIDVSPGACHIHCNSYVRPVERPLANLKLIQKWLPVHDNSQNIKLQQDSDLVFTIDTRTTACRVCTNVSTEQFSKYYDMSSLYRPHGPGVLHELGFPILIHLGIKHITTLGWDMTTYDSSMPHFYSKINDKPTGVQPYREELDILNSITPYSRYLESHNVNINIISDINILPENETFKKIKLS